MLKKAINLFLFIYAILSILTGCNTSDNPDNSDNFYKVTVTGSKNSLMERIKSSYPAGEVIEIKAHPVADVTLHVFVNGKEISMSHYDSDYWGYEFVMPNEDITVHLTYDRFYGRDEYEFDELYRWTGNLGNQINKVSVKTIYYADENSFIVTKYSSRQNDIDNFRAIVDQELIVADDSNVYADEAVRREYSFFYKDILYDERIDTLKFNDELFIWNDFATWQAFGFKDSDYALPDIENPDFTTYSFQYRSNSYVKRYDDESFSVRYYNMGSVEFIPYCESAADLEPTFYIDSSYGKINLLTPTVFELNGEYYEIVSGMDYWAYNYLDLKS